MKSILILVMACVFLVSCGSSPLFVVAPPCASPAITTATPLATDLCIPTPTGFCWPTDIGDPQGHGNWLADSCSWTKPGNYFNGLYHIGMDIKLAKTAEVYAIAEGKVIRISRNNLDDSKIKATVEAGGDPAGWGIGNIAILVDHQLVDGSHFVAVYGHIKYDPKNEIHNGMKKTVHPGMELGMMGPYPTGIHLHLGIFPILPGGPKSPSGNLGRMVCPASETTLNTNGFTDPYEWLISQTPKNPTVPIPTSVPCPLPAATPQKNRTSEPVTPVRNLIEAINARDESAALRSYSLADGMIMNPLLNVVFQVMDQQKIRATFSNMIYSSTSPQGGKATVSLGGKLDLYDANSDTHYTQDVDWDVGVYQSLGNWYIDLMAARQLLQGIEELIQQVSQG
jgi:murein DD-endopeptidase MepM/ murein hydrolase activator NlpD